ncbi:hypothetical protein MKX01_020635 [Papaver californicum]|nr:hypothetical protein MKX01_020635 [Papaver californicum]
MFNIQVINIINALFIYFFVSRCGLVKESPLGKFLHIAARFSPDDKYSRQRVLLKKRFGLLPTQKPAPKY